MAQLVSITCYKLLVRRGRNKVFLLEQFLGLDINDIVIGLLQLEVFLGGHCKSPAGSSFCYFSYEVNDRHGIHRLTIILA